MLQKTLMIRSAIALGILSVLFSHRCQTETQNTFVDLKDNETATFKKRTSEYGIRNPEFGIQYLFI